MYTVRVTFFDEDPRDYEYKTHADAENAARRLWLQRRDLPEVSHVELKRDGLTWQVWIVTNRGTNATNEIIRGSMGSNER